MSDVKFGSWTVAESPIAIEYSLVVIEEIRHEVVEGFQRLSRGGIEVGGILYGTREGRKVRILAIRPIHCEHARGPAFLLSDNDASALAEQLERDQQDPQLEGFVCVGWFLSHTRSEIQLADTDLEIYTAFFGAPWQVSMVVRPGRGGRMRAGFFIREADGNVNSERSYQEFNFPDRLAGVLDRAPRSERAVERRPVLEKRSSGREGAGTAPALSPPGAGRDLSVPPPTFGMLGSSSQSGAQSGARSASASADFLLPAPPSKKKWPWLVLWAVAVLGLAVFGLRYFMERAGPQPLALTVLEHDGQLQIEWNRNSRAVTAAVRGTLTIQDGPEAQNVPLAAPDLARGNFTYQRRTGDIEVRLDVEDLEGDRVQEASRYLGQPPQKVAPAEMQALEEKRNQLQAEINRLKGTNAAQAARIQELERTVRILQARLGGN